MLTTALTFHFIQIKKVKQKKKSPYKPIVVCNLADSLVFNVRVKGFRLLIQKEWNFILALSAMEKKLTI